MRTKQGLVPLLDRDPSLWRAALDERYQVVIDDVLEGRRPAVVYPAARLGQRAAAGLVAIGAQVVAFGDSDPSIQGTHIDGLPVLSPTEVAAAHRTDACLVASTMYDSVIREDLTARGCEFVVPVGYLNLRVPDIFASREYDGAWQAATDHANRPAIEAAFALLRDDESRRVFAGKLAFYLSLDKDRIDEIRSPETMYFDPRVRPVRAGEVVADGGAFVGDTLATFIRVSSGDFDAYHAFEPDVASFEKLAALAKGDPSRISAVRAGLGRQSSRARLSDTHGLDSRVLREDEPGGTPIDVVSLDVYFGGRRPPSLIKLDIEGHEADALLGAASLLTERVSTLAVSAYHYPTDLWTLPLLMDRLLPGSRLVMRHYSREIDDTVCYAVPDDR